MREAQVRQILAIGACLPVFGGTHEVAQRVAPESRVVYAGHDPVMPAYDRALLAGTPEGATDNVNADPGDLERILEFAAWTLDFARPIAVLLPGVLGHITDVGEAQAIVRLLMRAMPSGSYLVLVNPSGTSTASSSGCGSFLTEHIFAHTFDNVTWRPAEVSWSRRWC